jgi:hypothetical protein
LGVPQSQAVGLEKALLALLIVVVAAAHQDFWFWTATRPLLFGFLPPGLWYHAFYTLAVSALMALLCRRAWPESLERNAEQSQDGNRP